MIAIESILHHELTGRQMRHLIAIGACDLRSALMRASLAARLGWQDVRQRYHRSVLGPFWLTISMAVTIGSIGVVFSQVFHTSLIEFLPFLAIGLILWGFVSAVVTEGCTGFILAEGIIKQLPIPLFFHMFRLTWRNIIILAHNIVIVPVVFLLVKKPLSLLGFISLIGLVVLVLNVLWIASILAILCTRYRDLPQMVGSVLQIAFYVSPIIWMPSLAPQHAATYLLDTNLLYHLLEIVRSPLMGQLPSTTNWIVSVGMAAIGWIITLAIYGRFRQRVPYWL